MIKIFSFISEVYKPGVILEWESEDVILEIADNFKREDLDRYNDDFRKLLAFFEKKIPENFKLKLVRAREQYDEKELLKGILKTKDDKINEIKQQSEEEYKKTVARAERNYL
jgi:hypothetical protein